VKCYIALFINEHVIFSVMTFHLVTRICFCADVEAYWNIRMIIFHCEIYGKKGTSFMFATQEIRCHICCKIVDTWCE